MKRKLRTPDCPDVTSKRRRPSQDAPLPPPSVARAKRRRTTPGASLPLLPSPPASVSPVDDTTDAARMPRKTPAPSSSLHLPDNVDLLSPRTPVYHHSTPDPDFGERVCKAWEANRERTARLRPFKQRLRKYKYGEEIAALYSPGATPEHIANEYAHRQAELVRQYEEEMSNLSEDGEWERQEVLRRTQQNTNASQRHANGDPFSRQTASPSARIRRERDLERRDSHYNSSKVEPLPDAGGAINDSALTEPGQGEDECGNDEACGREQGEDNHGEDRVRSCGQGEQGQRL